MQHGAPRDGRRFSRDALHLFALSGFGVAQPIFDILSRNSAFFAAHRTGRLGIVAFALVLVLVPPALLAGAIYAVRRVSGAKARVAQAGLVGSLFALAVSPSLVRGLGPPTVLALLVFAAVAAVAGAAYTRSAQVRRFATFLAIAPPAFLVFFLAFSPVSQFFASATSAPRSAGAAARNSVVLLTLDEMSQGTLLRPDGSVDGTRFPNFARLAEMSTWYPNATTNSNVTQSALPSILTGVYPRSGPLRAPIAANHPDNLFELLSGTHRFEVDEWLTVMCPPAKCRDRLVAAGGLKHLVADTTTVYLHLVLPPGIGRRLPTVGNRWGGYFAEPSTVDQRAEQLPGPLRPLGRSILAFLADDALGSLEVRRFEDFIATVRRPSDPTLWFLHPALPHQPWHLLADGTPYDRQDVPGLGSEESRWGPQPLADQALQRYLLQAVATDRLLGDLITKLQDEEMWDDTLLILVADHGVVFTERENLRGVRGTEGDLLPIPFFVKLPGQTSGRIDRRNAEIVDVLPTIADVLGIDVPWDVDGSSLAGPDPLRPHKRVWAWGRPLPPYETPIGGRTEVSRRIRDLFGDGGGADDLYGIGPHRDLIGRAVGPRDAAGPRRGEWLEVDGPARFDKVDHDASLLPARVTGTYTGSRPPPWIAVTVNGRVAGLGRVWGAEGSRGFSAMLSPRYLEDGRNELAFFAVFDGGRVTRVAVAGS